MVEGTQTDARDAGTQAKPNDQREGINIMAGYSTLLRYSCEFVSIGGFLAVCVRFSVPSSIRFEADFLELNNGGRRIENLESRINHALKRRNCTRKKPKMAAT
jgi:hypothetical protein